MKTRKIISVLLSVLMIMSGMYTVSFASTDSVSIQGPSALLSAPEGKDSMVAYTAEYDGITAASSFEWEVTKEGAKATDVFFEDGSLIIKGGAFGTYTLSAEYEGIKGTKDITITASTVTNYGTITTDTDRYPSNIIDQTNGSKTIEFSFSIPSAPSGTANIILERGTSGYGGFSCEPISGNDSEYYIKFSKAGGTRLRYKTNPGQDGNITFKYGDTYNFKFVCSNLTQTTYQVYLNEQQIGMYYQNVIVSDFSTDHAQRVTLYSAAAPYFSRFVEYSGVETQYTPPVPVVTNNSQKTLLIPFDGKQVETRCTASADTEGTITWSLATPYTGVTIDGKGILTVKDTAAPGTVTVRASLGEVYDDADITLNKFEDSVTPSSEWYAGTVTEDNGNYYMSPGVRYRMDEAMRNRADYDFNIVFEMDIRSDSPEYFPSLIMTTAAEDYISFETAKVKTTDWINLKVIVNPRNGEYSALIEDAPVKLWSGGEENADKLTISSSSYPVIMRDIGSTNCQFDNLKIYNISNTPAIVESFNLPWYSAVDGTLEITDVKSTNIDMNEVSYEYKWFTCGKNGENEEEIIGKTDSSLDLSSLDLGKCFIKAKVRANHQSIISGEPSTVEGIWKESDVCIVNDFILGGPVLTINGTAADTKDIVITEDNTTVELIATLLHTDGTEKEIILALALYDSDGKVKTLTNIAFDKFTTEAIWTSDKSVSLTGLKKDSVVRAFVWYADGLKPIEY